MRAPRTRALRPALPGRTLVSRGPSIATPRCLHPIQRVHRDGKHVNALLHPSAASAVAHSWRVGPDASFWHDFEVNADAAADAAPFASPGHFIDMDEIAWDARGDYTLAQVQTQQSPSLPNPTP